MLTSIQSTPESRRFPAFCCAISVLAMLLLILGTALVPAWAQTSNLLGGEEPLSPEEVFIPSVTSVDEDFINVSFEISEDYYVYRDKMRFAITDSPAASAPGDLSVSASASAPSAASSLTLGSPIFSEAVLMTDDFFGEQATFRNSAQIAIPYTASSLSAQSVTLALTYQGCADIGLCYPPTTVPLTVDLPGRVLSSLNIDAAGFGSTAAELSASPLQPAASGSSFDATPLQSIIGLNSPEDELLPPELAYLPQVLSANDRQVLVQWHIEPGYYLYRDKLHFSVIDAGGAEVVAAEIDPGVMQHDEFFGNVPVLRNVAQAKITLDPLVDLTSANLATLQINYQGCADIGVCFPPSVATLPLAFDAEPSGLALMADNGNSAPPSASAIASSATASSAISNSTTGAATNTAANTAVEQSEQDRLFSMLGNSSLWLTVATFFGLGLLLAFTPCVLPMIPILSSLIVGQGDAMNTGKAFRLSLVYVLVMASTYAIVGIIVGLSGYNVQAFLQHPWVLSAIAVLFVLLSLSMFGFYELQMPTSLQAKLTQWSNKQGGGQVTGVAAMGFISTLIVGPCITAPLAGALIYIAKTGDAVVGGSALFALGLGMGAPLLLIGTSAGKLLPRAGAWMNTTKSVFGILLLGMAVYMISRFIPSTATMALYGVLALMSGVYLGATDTVDRTSNGWQRFGKGSGLVVSLYGLALLVGALAGGNSYTTPLRGVMMASGSNTSAEAEKHLAFQPVKSVEQLAQVVSEASSQGRPVMLDFYADWCISCKEMEAFTFTDTRVQALLSNAVLVQADVTANDKLDQELLKHFDLFGPPGIIFYDQSGREMPVARVVGFMNAKKFGNHIERHIQATSI